MTDIIGNTFRHFRQGISTSTWIVFATDRHACRFLTYPYQLIPFRCLRKQSWFNTCVSSSISSVLPYGLDVKRQLY